jgi:pyruvate dehydrogenase E2 component (dihydrolipoamide acetyltransferase)
MSVSVSMPQLGESVTEGTVTRWLKKEGDRVEADEPLLEVSTDKVDTEIPSPVSGVLRGITVGEDETVAVGAELAVIDEGGEASTPAAQPQAAPPQEALPQEARPQDAPAQGAPAAVPAPAPPVPAQPVPAQPAPAQPVPAQPPAPPAYEPPPGYRPPPAPAYEATAPAAPPPPAPPLPTYAPPAFGAPAPAGQPPAQQAPPPPAAQPPAPAPAAAEGPYVTPLVRKLAAEHGVDLATVNGTGVGGRIRKQDVLEAARALRETAPAPGAPAAPAPAPAPAAGPGAAAAPAPAAAAPARPQIVPSSLRGTSERLSRARQLIARRMVESLQTSAQLTTVLEADVTAIARLRERAKADFEAREGVRLSFLPFFAMATVEALKIHPRLNALIDTENNQVIYHDAEHLGIAVDTERGLMVPVIRNAGDLNIGGLARKIADLAQRTRSGQVSPDDLAGGTFTLTNTGSRGALFDTPIINQPQVAILGTGAVVKRPVVMEDEALGEVIAVRSMVYLALTYDHRLVDGADAARFLVTVKDRLEEGSFDAELGL